MKLKANGRTAFQTFPIFLDGPRDMRGNGLHYEWLIKAFAPQTAYFDAFLADIRRFVGPGMIARPEISADLRLSSALHFFCQ